MDKFDIKKNEIKKIQELIDNCNDSSVCINIYGKSGTGKTFLVQEALSKYFTLNNNVTVIYIDLIDDFLSTTAFWDIFLFTVWNGNINDKKSMLKINSKYSFSKYLQKKFRGKVLSNILLQSVTSIVATIPLYKAQLEVGGFNVAENNSFIKNENAIEKSQILIKYLKYVSRKEKLVIVLDNYQFMNITIRHYFESSINQISKNVAFINIQRTDRDNYQAPMVYQNKNFEIETLNLKLDDVLESVIKKNFSGITILDEVAED